ncbi:MAG TPA: neutral zinc metallopeptidase, partial [Vitreimonas sp.]|nr:neutral zinc metallopeptidase [Vitreimonas sp.]
RGGGMPIPIPGGRAGGGIGGLGLVILLAFFVLQMCGGGLDPGTGGGGGPRGGIGGIQAPGPAGSLPEEEEQVEFIKAVVEDVQVTWQEAFAAAGREYEETTLVLFEDAVSTACGGASSASGPFYCPADRKVYLDLSFFRELETRFGAPGDFAQAYVIAHEFGHHVQTILGISDSVRRDQQANPDRANDLSVRMELQADCFAGVWAHSVWSQPGEGTVESITEEDIREGLEAAAAIGDDRLQRQAGRAVNPESWTHGSSQQRMDWFQRGFREGTAEACDTFDG